MLLEIFAVFEVKLILSTLLNRAAGLRILSGCIAENRCAELLVDQNSGLVFGNAGMNGNDEKRRRLPASQQRFPPFVVHSMRRPIRTSFSGTSHDGQKAECRGLIEAEGVMRSP